MYLSSSTVQASPPAPICCQEVMPAPLCCQVVEGCSEWAGASAQKPVSCCVGVRVGGREGEQSMLSEVPGDFVPELLHAEVLATAFSLYHYLCLTSMAASTCTASCFRRSVTAEVASHAATACSSLCILESDTCCSCVSSQQQPAYTCMGVCCQSRTLTQTAGLFVKTFSRW